ncbi:1,4-dihydroxy-2-naphthoate octaprenyltransferase [Escherichia coli]|uniref:1,4-dihydroxy-2-naphthoate octaprenyltransferase n=1 Tax=Escherichia coli TaxID=562 RepID=A0A376L3R2_ECOLX|nr:1,4-dihydroxy-2-naphthoate octaprenyltransferase [Escherichia coli]
MTEQQISRTQAWLESLRPKTLPLAFAAIIVGTALAWWQGHFDPLVALLALITAGLLQILSNLANDYGDAVKGSDKPDRIGPLRGMQKGVITQQEMKRALIITVVLICLSGLALVAVGMPYAGRFCRFPDSWRVVDHCRYHLTPWAIVLMVISVWVIFPYWFLWLVECHGGAGIYRLIH